MIAKRDLQRSAPFVHPKRGEPLRSGLRRGAFTSSKRDIPARLRRRPNDFLAAPPASPTAPQTPLAQRPTPLRHIIVIRSVQFDRLVMWRIGSDAWKAAG